MKILELTLILGVILIVCMDSTSAQGLDKMPSPGEPHLLSRTSTTLRFTWTPPITDHRHPITGYSIQRREDLGNWRGVCRAITANVCEVTHLSPSSNQTFRIRASNTIGRGEWSEEVTFKTLPRADSAELCIPGGYNICLHQNRFMVAVDWSTNENNGRGGVRISTDTTGEFHLDPFEQAEVMHVELHDNCQATGFFAFRILTILDSKVDWRLKLTDGRTGEAKEYFNRPSNMNSILTDLEAFASCEA